MKRTFRLIWISALLAVVLCACTSGQTLSPDVLPRLDHLVAPPSPVVPLEEIEKETPIEAHIIPPDAQQSIPPAGDEPLVPPQQDAFAEPPACVWDVAYQTQSYVTVGEQIELTAAAYIEGTTDHGVIWSSLDPTVATVDASGVVTGVAEGYATIRATAIGHPSCTFDLGVTVYAEDADPVVKAVILAHNSTIESVPLGVGSGTPAYYTDLIESVSKLLFNTAYTVNIDYESVQARVSGNHGGALDGVEFITVHYTGNMNALAGASFHAGYFATGVGGTSVHYVVGNDGVYHILSDDLIAYHAGDGAGTASKLVWLPTGVPYREGDPIYPEWGISANSRYTLNGVETSIDVPTGTTAATRRVTDARWINKMGFAYRVVDGEYYMAKTWWCYAQVAEGRLCTKGGNRTSIGIETCVNRGSDLWTTWHLTARLVARLMARYDLSIDRVVGHHFYTAKDCPQPFLADDLDLWWDFIDCVRAEYDLLTLGEGYTVSMTVLDGDNVTDTGRVTSLPTEGAHLIRYQVTVTSPNGTQKVVTLASLAHPMD